MNTYYDYPNTLHHDGETFAITGSDHYIEFEPRHVAVVRKFMKDIGLDVSKNTLHEKIVLVDRALKMFADQFEGEYKFSHITVLSLERRVTSFVEAVIGETMSFDDHFYPVFLAHESDGGSLEWCDEYDAILIEHFGSTQPEIANLNYIDLNVRKPRVIM